ncbi:hypothetical protein [Actinacidiphila sp. bgisy167]|uniref:hypothetical protein n=1 Tax=Actinacidiphila sp. bgisy167 TaxID=3413797 RepID=UPI003D7121A0
MAETGRHSSSAVMEAVAHPLDTMKSTAQRLPGAGVVKETFDSVLDTVGVVSPRKRRVAAYAGAGLLGAAGVVEWPVAAAGAAAVWLTQQRSGARREQASAREATGEKPVLEAPEGAESEDTAVPPETRIPAAPHAQGHMAAAPTREAPMAEKGPDAMTRPDELPVPEGGPSKAKIKAKEHKKAKASAT